MKVKCYISIGKRKKGTFTFRITKKKSYMPLDDGNGYNSSIVPTICFPIAFNLPDDVFDNDPTTEISPEIKKIRNTSAPLSTRIKKKIEEEITQYKTDQLAR